MRTQLLFRAVWLGLLAGTCVLLPACESDGHFTCLGYTTRPNYDPTIHFVRVPIFKNETYRRGLEFKLTQAVIEAIEANTTYKVVPASHPADVELTGKIVSRNKSLILFNQLGEVREADTTLAVELVYRDLRPGKMGDPKANPFPDASVPPPLNLPVPEPKTLVQSLGTFRPELGESLTTAEQQMIQRAAISIISLMEPPW